MVYLSPPSKNLAFSIFGEPFVSTRLIFCVPGHFLSITSARPVYFTVHICLEEAKLYNIITIDKNKIRWAQVISLLLKKSVNHFSSLFVSR